jgi:hypothetical protein
MDTLVKPVHPSKTPTSIFVTLEGIVMLGKREHDLKAFVPILLIVVFALKVTLSKYPTTELNALLDIDVTESGITASEPGDSGD